MFIYLIKSGISLFVLWALYRVLLSGATFFRLCRIVLVGGTAACLLLPFVRLDVEEAPVQAPVLRLEEVLTEAPLPMEFAEWAEPAVETVAAPEPSRPLRNGLPALYLLGVLAAGGWLLAGYLRMAQLMRKARRHKADGVTWCLTPCAVKPFSWGATWCSPRRSSTKAHS